MVKVEGYEDIRIFGFWFDMDNDFKMWVGIIYVFVKYKVVGDIVMLLFVEFVRLCGILIVRLLVKLCKCLDSLLSCIVINIILFCSKGFDEFYVMYFV